MLWLARDYLPKLLDAEEESTEYARGICEKAAQHLSSIHAQQSRSATSVASLDALTASLVVLDVILIFGVSAFMIWKRRQS
jgi:hypothetical protein